ncbi:MAG TPA: AMP-binding protein [Polyangiaceae bacterium]|nr:AMP-binding protein [Polyangiaceae bacterium]
MTVTLADTIERAARATRGGFRFVEDGGGEELLPFAALVAAADRAGAALAARGVAPGDRVVLILGRPRDFIAAFLGAARIGAVPVPLYPPAGLRRPDAYAAATALALERARARALVADAPVLALFERAGLAAAPAIRIAAEPLRADAPPPAPARPAPADPCFIQFTSGSTAAPRGVVVSHENLAANVQAFMHEGLRVTPEDSGVTWLPLYHDMGLIGFVLGPLYTRNTVTFLAPQTFLKRPLRWLETIARHRATVSFGPSSAYALVARRAAGLDLGHLDLSSWRVAGCGAEPIHAPTLAAFAAALAPARFDPRALVACYGLAEATLAVTFAALGRGIASERVAATALHAEGRAVAATDPADAVELTACGRAFQDHEVAVFPPEAAAASPLPERAVGEIRVRGPSVTRGYFGEPPRGDAGGWLRTGDLGYLAGGELFVCGRSKELVIVGGRNYFPQDLEEHAAAVPGVRRGHLVAFGARAPAGDRERVVLVVEATARDAAARAAIARDVARAVTAATGLPVDEVHVVRAGALPKTSSGKLRRTEVRALHAAGRLAELDEPGPRDDATTG